MICAQHDYDSFHQTRLREIGKADSDLPATSETPEETPEEKTAREHSETQVTLKAVNYSG